MNARRPAIALAVWGLASACGSGPTTPAVAPIAAMPAAAPVASANLAPPPSAVHHTPAELDLSLATARAPDFFRTRFVTTKGDFVVEVRRDWAPNGADRFFNLAKMGFYDDTRLFRVISGFMAQFGIPGDARVASKWRDATIPDDPVVQSNLRGFMTFAQTGMPNSRTTQIFINYRDNTRLDASTFTPFGRVVQGMDIVDSFYNGYGEGAPEGHGPSQERAQSEGNVYLDQEFPKLDRILSTQIVTP
jgi:peptidyl-prolyl cis-trans isomerase A (cyclophilin A)